jgi:hypothetical protein
VVRTFRAIRYFVRREIPPAILQGTFSFDGSEYEYFCHQYNNTWRNERAVEIPIISNMVKSCTGRVLEVGNVLPHYFPTSHEVVDKYETWPGVINEDIVGFKSPEPYDLIVSISTLEHIGFDEPIVQPGKIKEAIESLKENLKVGAKMVVTMPLGQNPEVNELVRDGSMFDELRFMKKVSKGWRETSKEEALASPYDRELGSARAVVIATIKRIA